MTRTARMTFAGDLARVLPGLLVVALMLVWAVHDGGYDAETWYWGALAALSLTVVAVVTRPRERPVPRAAAVALALFALYVAWSYLSILWAQAPGVALDGSNRALLYLLVFAVLLLVDWTDRSASAALVAYAIGVGAIAVVLLVRFASADRVADLIALGRLAAPTGYFNATAALFTTAAVTGIVLALRRELPGPLRGLLLALACGELQLALIVQSRGWLFTLPIIAVAVAVVATDRLRLVAFALVPLAGLAPIAGRLLDVFSSSAAGLGAAAARAGQAGLLVCAAVFVAGTLLAWGDWLLRERRLPRSARGGLGTAVVVLAVAAAVAGGTVATHGHPGRFLSRQWNGFSHEQQNFSTHSHFGDVGSGRYDFWRVSLDAFLAHPLGGLGQDNFADYYVLHRHTGEEPSWTHSFEMRLLAHTGLVGTVLFAAFLITALVAAARTRRRGPPAAGLAAAALMPLMVWLIYGSIDWFWEMPALTGPALGFLAMATRIRDTDPLASPDSAATERPGSESVAARTPGSESVAARTPGSESVAAVRPRRIAARGPRLAGGVVLLVAGVAATVVLALGYLSTRETSIGSDLRFSRPAAALDHLSQAASLDPLSAIPDSLAGAIALQNNENAVALARFRRAIDREPGGWFAWLGAGIAASGLQENDAARRYLERAYAINSSQPVNRIALRRLRAGHPLTYAEAQKLFVLTH